MLEKSIFLWWVVEFAEGENEDEDEDEDEIRVKGVIVKLKNEEACVYVCPQQH